MFVVVIPIVLTTDEQWIPTDAGMTGQSKLQEIIQELGANLLETYGDRLIAVLSW
jgi:hypothetical protein